MNQFFEALANMPPEQLAILLGTIIAAIVGTGRWFGVRIAKERDAELAKRDVEIATAKAQVSAIEAKNDLQAKESESRHLQMIEMLKLVAQSNDNVKDVSAAIRDSAKAQGIASQRLVDAIERNSDEMGEMKDVIETQSQHFQNLTKDITEAKQASQDAKSETVSIKSQLETFTNELLTYKQKVDEMINRWDVYLEHAPKKSEWTALKESFGKSLRDLETKLDEWMHNLENVQKQSDAITNPPIEKEKESS